MGARFLLIGTVSICLVPGSDGARAQSATGDDRSLARHRGVGAGRRRSNPAKREMSRRVAPDAAAGPCLPDRAHGHRGLGHRRRQGAGQHQRVDAAQIERTGSLNITDALQQQVPGVIVNEVAGNPFQPNVEFRGFVASPVSGTPQGLAVYQNGVRINEAFGDTVNWDLIPTAAIRSVTVVTNNPAFGLNALGGAVNVQMKDGFNYQGAEIDTMGGSFGRIQSSAQWGKQIDNFAVYGALEGLHDNGFRNFSPSDIRRFYGDVGYKIDGSEFHLNMGVADNNFGASATVPVELLQQYWGATYTTPQTSNNRSAIVNLTGKVEATPTWTIEGAAHVRVFEQKTGGRQSDRHPAVRCRSDAALLSATTRTAGQRPEWRPARQSVRSPAPCSAKSTARTTRSTTAGVSLQATNTDQLFGHDNHFVVGASFDSSVTRFTASAELGTIGPNYRRHRQRHIPRTIRRSRFDRPGLASHHQPLHRALRARHVRRHQRVLDHRRRPFQRRAASSSRTRSAPRSTATRPSTASIRSSAAPTRSRRS